MKRYAPLAGVLVGTVVFSCTIFAPYVPPVAAMGLAVASFFASALGTAYNWPMPRPPVAPSE